MASNDHEDPLLDTLLDDRFQAPTVRADGVGKQTYFRRAESHAQREVSRSLVIRNLNESFAAVVGVRLPADAGLQSWDVYHRHLTERKASAPDIRRLRAQYLNAAEPRPTAAVPTADSELQATSATQFVALLKTIVMRAKLTGTKLAERAGLSTSQMYSMTNVGRGVLPTKAGQVGELVTACGLPRDQVVRVMRLWDELRNQGKQPVGAQGMTDPCMRVLVDLLSDRTRFDATSYARLLSVIEILMRSARPGGGVTQAEAGELLDKGLTFSGEEVA